MDHSMCLNSLPRLFIVPFFLNLSLMALFLWSCRYGGFESILASHILLSQRSDPKEKQVKNLDQDCASVWIFLVDGGGTPLHDFSLSCIFFGMGYLFFLLFFFDMLCGHVAYLHWVCIFSLFF